MDKQTHCQICARDIKAKTGAIAHHGYQRPGNGWQTASCLGAKYKPYEESRDRILEVIEIYKGQQKFWTARAKDLVANPPETIDKTNQRYTYAKGWVYETETFNRPENFDAKATADTRPSFYDKYEREFYDVVQNARRNVSEIREAISFLQERYENWKRV